MRRAVDGLRRPEAAEKPIEGADAGGMSVFKATEDGIQGTPLQLLHLLGNRRLAHFEHQQMRPEQVGGIPWPVTTQRKSLMEQSRRVGEVGLPELGHQNPIGRDKLERTRGIMTPQLRVDKRLIGGMRSDNREHTCHLNSEKIGRANALLGDCGEAVGKSTFRVRGGYIGVRNCQFIALDGRRAWGQMALAFGSESLPRLRNGIPRGYSVIEAILH